MTPEHYERVQDLCRDMHRRNMFSSCICVDDPAYHEIVALGADVVPALLRRLDDFEDNDGMAVWEVISALYAITKADPIPQAHAGRLTLVIEDWLVWGRKEGHEWDD